MSSDDTQRSRAKVAQRERLVAAFLGVTALGAVGFAVAYALGAQTQVCAGLLLVTFAFLSAAMVVFEHEVMPRYEAVEIRDPLPSGEEKNIGATQAFMRGADEISMSRGWIVKVFAGAVTAVGVALLFPLRSLAPAGAKTGEVARTNWRRGLKLVREDGSVVRASELAVNGILTVFPQGYTGPEHTDAMANDATVLVRVPPDEIRLPAARESWAPDGLLAYSKVCTHAGCPVALYRAAARQLFCPCHQSTFNVLDGGERIFGPAARALPQLPIEIAPDGSVVASDGYPEPIGPGYWERA